MLPHSTYIVGYTFMNGVPVMAKSNALFYVGVFGRLRQLAFRAFENLHIDRINNVLFSPPGNGKDVFLEHSKSATLMNFNILRASDQLLTLTIVYLIATLLRPLPSCICATHVAALRLLRNGFLGYLLKMESR
ncbi:phosphatidylethanolaminen-methyltransferase-lik e protein [Lotmaria passim]